LLARLCARTEREVLVEASALTPDVRRTFEHGRASARVRAVDAVEMIRSNKERGAHDRLTLVTFPFHRATSTRHAREAAFFGKPHRIDIVEALLHFRGASPVLALEKPEGAPVRVASHARASLEAPTEAEAAELASFLADCSASLVRAMPEAFASVADMYARSVAAGEVREAMDRAFLRSYLRAWRDDAGLGEPAVAAGLAAVGS
jgi:hypothetical protein